MSVISRQECKPHGNFYGLGDEYRSSSVFEITAHGTLEQRVSTVHVKSRYTENTRFNWSKATPQNVFIILLNSALNSPNSCLLSGNLWEDDRATVMGDHRIAAIRYRIIYNIQYLCSEHAAVHAYLDTHNRWLYLLHYLH